MPKNFDEKLKYTRADCGIGKIYSSSRFIDTPSFKTTQSGIGKRETKHVTGYVMETLRSD